MAVHTGLRVSELANLTISDIVLGTGARLHCYGKGRKNRSTPLAKPAATALKNWLAERGGQASEPVFPTRKGTPLSRDAIAKLLAKHVQTAALSCPSLSEKNVTPHTLRHTTAMLLLHGGVDITVIALWLGHESTEATQIYLHADMSLKEKALARLTPTSLTQPGRYKAPDVLLNFLATL